MRSTACRKTRVCTLPVTMLFILIACFGMSVFDTTRTDDTARLLAAHLKGLQDHQEDGKIAERGSRPFSTMEMEKTSLRARLDNRDATKRSILSSSIEAGDLDAVIPVVFYVFQRPAYFERVAKAFCAARSTSRAAVIVSVDGGPDNPALPKMKKIVENVLKPCSREVRLIQPPCPRFQAFISSLILVV